MNYENVHAIEATPSSRHLSSAAHDLFLLETEGVDDLERAHNLKRAARKIWSELAQISVPEEAEFDVLTSESMDGVKAAQQEVLDDLAAFITECREVERRLRGCKPVVSTMDLHLSFADFVRSYRHFEARLRVIDVQRKRWLELARQADEEAE